MTIFKIKNRLNMECFGAVIALGDKTENLDKKIEKLEQIIGETSKTNEKSELEFKLKYDTLPYKANLNRDKSFSDISISKKRYISKFTYNLSRMKQLNY